MRVAGKSDIREWSNSRGEGKLFNMTLLDESGEIKCTLFRDLVDKYYNLVEVLMREKQFFFVFFFFSDLTSCKL